jgi:hypothetical protein
MKCFQVPRPERVWGPPSLLSVDTRGCLLGGQCDQIDKLIITFMPPTRLQKLGHVPRAKFNPLFPLLLLLSTTTTTNNNNFFFLWCYSPNRAQAPSLLRFLDHKQLDRHTVGLLWTSEQLVAETATYTTHNKHKRKTSMPSAGFEPAIPAIKRL